MVPSCFIFNQQVTCMTRKQRQRVLVANGAYYTKLQLSASGLIHLDIGFGLIRLDVRYE